jgi:WD40 repeat protein
MGRIGVLKLYCPGSSITFRVIRRCIGFVIACSLVTAGAAAVCFGSQPEEPVAAVSTPTFATDVTPILQKNCIVCHSSSEHKSGLSLDSYESLMQGGKHGRVVVPNDASSSRLIEMLEGKINPQMPAGEEPLADADIAKIKQWINAGAAGPPANEALHLTPSPTTPTILPEVSVVSPISSLGVSPDGLLLAVGGYREVRLVDPVSGESLATLSGHADYVRSIAFSPDGKMLAAAGGAPQSEGEIRIWDIHSHQLLKILRGHKDCIYSVAWSRDGKLIASGSYDRMVKLWDASTGKELDHIDAVFAVSFNPSGTQLASASQDRTVKIWDVATGKRIYTLSDASDGLTSVAYSPTGNRLAAVGYDKTIYVWELAAADGHLSQSLIADQDSVLALVWSPDGRTIVTASSDRSIRFRDTKLELLGVIDRQPDWVEALAISPDSKWLAAGRYNGTLSFYDARTYKETRSMMNVFGVKQPAPADKMHEAAN